MARATHSPPDWDWQSELIDTPDPNRKLLRLDPDVHQALVARQRPGQTLLDTLKEALGLT